MDKRKFLKLAGIMTAGSLVYPIVGCNPPAEPKDTPKEPDTKPEIGGNFKLPTLSFEYAALAPNIDAQTMEIHYTKHHAGYVKKLNAALVNSPLAGKPLHEILAFVSKDQWGIRNNGGGHFNHSLFWSNLSPKGGGTPKDDLLDAIKSSFGSFDKFKEQFSAAAKGVFGSGWAWLSLDENKKLFISNTPNQDNPLMRGIVKDPGTPILGLDVWEHAYYLKYQNKRGDYIQNYFNIIDWNSVGEKLKALG